MNIYYVRHGQTDFNLLHRVQGCIDIPLNKHGIAQAKESGKIIKNIDFDAVYTSQLVRTQQTAQHLLDGRVCNFTIDSRLAERNYAMYEGFNYQVLRGSKMDFYKSYSELDYTIGGVETLREMIERIEQFFEDLRKQDYDNVLLVSHGGIGRVIYHVLKNTDLDEITSLFIDNCEVIKYEL